MARSSPGARDDPVLVINPKVWILLASQAYLEVVLVFLCVMGTFSVTLLVSPRLQIHCPKRSECNKDDKFHP